MRPLVLGIGNPLRGDDGFGASVIERLEAMELGGIADLRIVHQLTPELVDDVARAVSVVFVDAAVDLAPGVWAQEECAPRVGPWRWTHVVDPGRLLALACAVHGSVPPACLIRVGATRFVLGAPLSDAVAAAVDTVAELVADRVARALLNDRREALR